MPIARAARRTLARSVTCAAALGFTLWVCVTPALSSLARIPTLATWDRAADASCNSANVAIDELSRPSSLAIEVADLGAMITIGTRETAALAAIPPPPSHASMIARFVRLSRAGKPLAQELIAAYRDAKATEVTTIENRSTTLNNRYNALAVTLGARTCALNPQPGTLHASAIPSA